MTAETSDWLQENMKEKENDRGVFKWIKSKVSSYIIAGSCVFVLCCV